MQDWITEYIECDCHTELLQLSLDPDDNCLYISMYNMGGRKDNRFGFMQKLRFIWQIIKHSEPYGDQVILNPMEITKLKTFINTIKIKNAETGEIK